MNDSQAASELLKYLGKLGDAGIGMERAFAAYRFSGTRYAVASVGMDAEAIGESDIFFLEENEVREKYALVYSLLKSGGTLRTAIFIHPRFCREAAGKVRNLPPVLDDMAQIVGARAQVCGLRDSRRLVRILKKSGACLIGGEPEERGSLSVGRNLRQAFSAALVLEKSAQVYLQGKALGGARPLNPFEAQLMHLIYQFGYSRKPEAAHRRTQADYIREIPEREMELRRQIAELGRQLSRENLVQGTWGNISVRLDEKYFLCTPSGLDYFAITPWDIVRVELLSLQYEGDTKPTSEKTFHAALLREHPEVQCVIHSHPVNCSVFAAAHVKIPVKDETRRALLNGDAEVAAYGLPSTKKLTANVAAAIRQNRACVMENHGMLVCGTSAEDAHEKCRAAEESARLILQKLEQGDTM